MVRRRNQSYCVLVYGIVVSSSRVTTSPSLSPSPRGQCPSPLQRRGQPRSLPKGGKSREQLACIIVIHVIQRVCDTVNTKSRRSWKYTDLEPRQSSYSVHGPRQTPNPNKHHRPRPRRHHHRRRRNPAVIAAQPPAPAPSPSLRSWIDLVVSDFDRARLIVSWSLRSSFSGSCVVQPEPAWLWKAKRMEQIRPCSTGG